MFNRPLAARVGSWEGVDARLGLIPIGLLLLYALLKSNYDRISVVREALALFPNEASGKQVSWLRDYLVRHVRFSGSRAYFRISRADFNLDAPNPVLTLHLSIANGTPYTLRIGRQGGGHIALDVPRSEGGATFARVPEFRGRPRDHGIPSSGRDDAQILQFLEPDEASELSQRLQSDGSSLTLHLDEVDFVVEGSWPSHLEPVQQNRRLWLSDAVFAMPTGACLRHGGFP